MRDFLFQRSARSLVKILKTVLPDNNNSRRVKRNSPKTANTLRLVHLVFLTEAKEERKREREVH